MYWEVRGMEYYGYKKQIVDFCNGYYDKLAEIGGNSEILIKFKKNTSKTQRKIRILYYCFSIEEKSNESGIKMYSLAERLLKENECMFYRDFFDIFISLCLGLSISIKEIYDDNNDRTLFSRFEEEKIFEKYSVFGKEGYIVSKSNKEKNEGITYNDLLNYKVMNSEEDLGTRTMFFEAEKAMYRFAHNDEDCDAKFRYIAEYFRDDENYNNIRGYSDKLLRGLRKSVRLYIANMKTDKRDLILISAPKKDWVERRIRLECLSQIILGDEEQKTDFKQDLLNKIMEILTHKSKITSEDVSVLNSEYKKRLVSEHIDRKKIADNVITRWFFDKLSKEEVGEIEKILDCQYERDSETIESGAMIIYGQEFRRKGYIDKISEHIHMKIIDEMREVLFKDSISAKKFEESDIGKALLQGKQRNKKIEEISGGRKRTIPSKHKALMNYLRGRTEISPEKFHEYMDGLIKLASDMDNKVGTEIKKTMEKCLER